MSTLLMWQNRFSENENETVEGHISRQGQKTTTLRFQDQKTTTSRFED